MVEYWLASKFGQLWLSLHKGLRPALGEMPTECARLARGQRFTADRLHRAQGFAARVWWRAGMASVLLVFPVIGVSAAVRPGRIGTDTAVVLIFGLGCLAGLAMLQMGLISFRGGQTRLHMVTAGPNARDEPLPPGSLGLPSRFDFWVIMVVAMAVFGILLYAGTRTVHSG